MTILLKLFAFLLLMVSYFVIYDRYEMRQGVQFHPLAQINPIPKAQKLISQNKLVEADEYLSFFIDNTHLKNQEEAQKLLIDVKRKREDVGYRADKIVDGVLHGKSDEIDGQIAAGISDLFLFGDLRDLTIEGYHKLSNQEVDDVLVALSLIGVVASGSTLITVGSTAPIKGTTSFLKFAKKSKKLPSWLAKYIVKSSKELKNTKSLKPIQTLFTDMYTMIKASGVNGGLKLLNNTKDIASLKKAVKFSKVYGKNSSALVSILGKDALKFSNTKISKKAFLNAATYGEAGVKRITKISKKAFLNAATYGEAGVKRITKMGEKNFLKSLVKPIKVSRVTKVFDKNIAHVLDQIPNAIFYVMGLVAIAILV